MNDRDIIRRTTLEHADRMTAATRASVNLAGNPMTVRAMMPDERSAFATEHAASDDMTTRTRLLARTLSDGQGQRIFDDADATTLALLPLSDLLPAVAVALAVNPIASPA